MPKPIVAIVASKYSSDSIGEQENGERLALIYACQTELDCEVLADHYSIYDLLQKEAQTHLSQLNQQERLAAIIIYRSRYDIWTSQKIAEFQKNDLHQVPIIILAEDDNEDEPLELGQHEGFFVYNSFAPHEEEFWLDLKEKTETTKRNLVSKAQADSLTLQQLQQAYANNYSEEDMLSEQDSNTSAVAEMMRLRLFQQEAPQLVKQEFDDAIQTKNPFYDFQEFEIINEEIYQADLQKIATLDKDGKRELTEEIIVAMGGRERVGYGDNCYGFAYDPQTSGFILTNEFGLHQFAGRMLGDRIIRIKSIKKQEVDDDMCDYYGNNFLRGLLFKVKSYQTPILLVQHYHEVYKKGQLASAIDFFKRQRRFIAIDDDNNLMPGQLD